MQAPKVFILVVNWNGWRDTLRCLASLDELDYPHYRIIVVDNASTDGSETEIRTRRPDLEILQAGVNLGYAGGNNVGIKHALQRGADYVWILNNDTLVRPEALSRIVAVAESDKRIGIVGPSEFTSREPWEGARLYATTARHRWLRDVPVSCPGHEEDSSGLSYHLVGFASGAALFLRSKMLWEVGLFDEQYFHYAEEIDLNERAVRAGWRVSLACRSHVWHAGGASLPGRSPQALYYQVRNLLLMKRKIFGYGVVRTFLRHPRFTLGLLRTLTTGLVRGERAGARAIRLGVADAFRQRTGRRELDAHGTGSFDKNSPT